MSGDQAAADGDRDGEERGPPRAILDTNVFVAAGFNPRSASARLLEAARAGRLAVVWTPATRKETTAVLKRIPRLGAGVLEEVLDEANRFDGPVDPARASFVEDPEDRKFAALAMASGATLLTNDAHLLDHPGSGYHVSTPGAFLRANPEIGTGFTGAPFRGSDGRR